MEQLRLFEQDQSARNGPVPITPLRVGLAVVTGLAAAASLKISGLHWGAFDPSFDLGIAELVTAALAVLVVLSATFAKSKALRIVAYFVAVLAAAHFGAESLLGKVVVGLATLACGLLTPYLFRGLARSYLRVRRRVRRGSNPTVATAAVTLFLALAFVGPLVIAVPPAVALARAESSCGTIAALSIRQLDRSGSATSIDLSGDRVVVELPGDVTEYRFVAESGRTGDVAVWFDAFEPFELTDDILAWADDFSPDDPARYAVALRRTGPLGVYEIHFPEEGSAGRRDTVAVVPGRTVLVADFALRDGVGIDRCRVVVEVLLRTEPYTTLFGLGSIGAAALATATVSPTRRNVVDGTAPPALWVRDLQVVSALVGGRAMGARKAALKRHEAADFEIKLTAKVDHDEEELERLEEAGVEAIGFDEVVSLVSMKPSFVFESGEIQLKIAGTVKAGDDDGSVTGSFVIECAGEKVTESFTWQVLEQATDEEIIDAREHADEALGESDRVTDAVE